MKHCIVRLLLLSVISIYGNSSLFAQVLPQSWRYTSFTGTEATVIIPKSIQSTCGDSLLNDGDVIGVFIGTSDVCAGYSMYHRDSTTVLTVWGDNDQTPEKDGFQENDVISLRIWRSSQQREFHAECVYEVGDSVYMNDKIYILQSLRGVATPTGIIQKEIASTSQDDTRLASLVYLYSFENQWFIRNISKTTINSVSVYSLLGQEVYENSSNNFQSVVHIVPNFVPTEQVYFVRIVFDNRSVVVLPLYMWK